MGSTPPPKVPHASVAPHQMWPVLRAIFTALAAKVEFDAASVALLGEDGKAMVLVGFDADSADIESRNTPVSANITRVLSSGVAMLNQRLRPYDATSHALVDRGIRCTIIAPLRTRRNLIGTINMGSCREGGLTHADVKRVTDILERFAGALGRSERHNRHASNGFHEVAPGLTPAESRTVPTFLFRPERVADQMRDALVIDDVDGRIVFANRAFRELFGIDEENLTSLKLESYVVPEDRETLRKRHDDRVRGKPVLSDSEYVGLHRDGRRLDLEVSVVPVIEDGVTLGTQSVIRDVSARKAMERKHAHATKMEALGQLAGGVAHDFNNLLTALLSYPDLIRDRLANERPIEPELAELERAAERASVLARRLLTFSRQQVVKPERVQVSQALGEVMPMLHRLIDEVTIHSRLKTGGAAVEVGPGQLEQIVVNLVLNARDAGAKEIVVEATTAKLDAAGAANLGVEPGRYAVISVVDDGSGVPSHVAAKMFQPFFTTKPIGEGTGLGLAIVHGIVKSNAGHIEVDSNAGRGTVLRLHLPVIDVVPDRKSSVRPTFSRRSATVLLAEDDEVSHRVLRAILESTHMKVIGAFDGREAMAILDDDAVQLDLLLTDLVMPRADGAAVVKHSRNVRPGLPVVMMSGHAAGKLAELVPQLDARFLEKPIKRGVLLQMIDEVLGK
jgi:two-component system, cell cycle sensor histidine kinase and response regulator CckA